MGVAVMTEDVGSCNHNRILRTALQPVKKYPPEKFFEQKDISEACLQTATSRLKEPGCTQTLEHLFAETYQELMAEAQNQHLIDEDADDLVLKMRSVLQ